MQAARPSLTVTSASGRDLTGVLGHVRGVAAVDATRPVEVVLTDGGSANGTTAGGISPATFQRTRRLDVQEGSLGRLGGDAVAMSQTFAHDGGYHVGKPVRLAFLDGTAKTLTLVAIVADAPDLVPDVMLSKTLAGRHVTAAVPGRWIVLPAPGVRLSQLARGVRDTVRPAGVERTSAWLRARSETFRRTNNQGLLITLGPAGGYAGIAIVSTLLVGSLRRRREFVVTRLLGATPRHIRQMILWESSLVGLAALTIAGAITATVSLLARQAMMAGVHAVTTTVPWPTLGRITLACLGLAVAAGLAPAARVLRDAQPSAAAVE
jgi:putative ABC transport system permease protein